jgi:hypothetical protein
MPENTTMPEAEAQEVAEPTVANWVEAHVPPVGPFTPYACAGIASRIVGHRVREQMLYNYAAKGYIQVGRATKVTNRGTTTVKSVQRDELVRWLSQYATRFINPDGTPAKV